MGLMKKQRSKQKLNEDMEKRLWYDDGNLTQSLIKEIEEFDGRGRIEVKLAVSWSGIISKKDILDSVEKVIKEAKNSLFD